MCIFTLIEQKKNEAFARRESKRLMNEEEERKAREVMENRRVDSGGSGPGTIFVHFTIIEHFASQN